MRESESSSHHSLPNAPFLFFNRATALERVLHLRWRWECYQEQLERKGGVQKEEKIAEVAQYLTMKLQELQIILVDLARALSQSIRLESRFDDLLLNEPSSDDDERALLSLLSG